MHKHYLNEYFLIQHAQLSNNQFFQINWSSSRDTTPNIDMVIIGLIINILLGYLW